MKNRRGEVTVGTIILLFIGIIIAFAFLEAIFNTQGLLTNKNPVINETIIMPRNATTDVINSSVVRTISQSGNARAACLIDNIAVVNSATGATFTSGGDYLFTPSAGTLVFYNTYVTQMANTTNTTYVSYNYCQEGYNQDSSSRTVAGLIGLFSVLILLAFLLETGKLQEMLDSMNI